VGGPTKQKKIFFQSKKHIFPAKTVKKIKNTGRQQQLEIHPFYFFLFK
jgi:hypothetical protein